jgi:hypothetical protein
MSPHIVPSGTAIGPHQNAQQAFAGKRYSSSTPSSANASIVPFCCSSPAPTPARSGQTLPCGRVVSLDQGEEPDSSRHATGQRGVFLTHALFPASSFVLISGRLSASLNLGLSPEIRILASRFHEVVQNILDGATIPPIKNYSPIRTPCRHDYAGRKQRGLRQRYGLSPDTRMVSW